MIRVPGGGFCGVHYHVADNYLVSDCGIRRTQQNFGRGKDRRIDRTGASCRRIALPFGKEKCGSAATLSNATVGTALPPSVH